MNLDGIMSDEKYIVLDDNHNVAFYSLSIGLEEYFETYHRVCVYLTEYERDDKERINKKAGYKLYKKLFKYSDTHSTFTEERE